LADSKVEISKLKVAIVHDWLTGMRGGEKVLEQLCALFPAADIYTLLWVKGSVSPSIEKHKITTSFLQRFPDVEKRYRYYLPLMPAAIQSMRLKGYDLVISQSTCVAKGISIDNQALHICYCNTPMRYIWDQYDEYFNSKRSGRLTSLAMGIARPFLQRWDLRSNKRVNKFLANSKNVQERIKRIYSRESEVIYPPVDIGGYPAPFNGGYFLMVTALVPYKRADLAVRAFNENGYPLKIIGSGPDAERLKGIAGKNIEFLGWLDTGAIKKYYAGCKALIFPQEEDFGITAVESQAAGKPVVAFAKGGGLETVIEGETGAFFHEASVKSLNEAVERVSGSGFNPARIKQNAARFSEERFKREIIDFIVKNW
jgi:glycosyltransferase involved in cell wall biosynthesis